MLKLRLWISFLFTNIVFLGLSSWAEELYSEVNLPIEIESRIIENLLDSSFGNPEKDGQIFIEHQKFDSVDLEIEVFRDNNGGSSLFQEFDVVGRENSIEVSVPLKVKVRGDWRFLFAKTAKTVWARVLVEGRLSLDVTESWELRPDVQLGFQWIEKPFVRFGSLGKIRIATISEQILDEQLNKLEVRAEEFLSKEYRDLNVAERLGDLWRRLYWTEDSMSENALNFRPTSLTFGGLSGDENSVGVSLGLKGVLGYAKATSKSSIPGPRMSSPTLEKGFMKIRYPFEISKETTLGKRLRRIVLPGGFVLSGQDIDSHSNIIEGSIGVRFSKSKTLAEPDIENLGRAIGDSTFSKEIDLTEQQVVQAMELMTEVSDRWTDENGFINLHPDRNYLDNENPVLFTSEYIYAIWRLGLLKGRVRDEFKSQTIEKIDKLRLEPGLFNRYPGRTEEAFARHFSRDEQIGLILLDRVFDWELGYAEELYNYGVAHDFVFQNRTWNKRDFDGWRNLPALKLRIEGQRDEKFIELLRLATGRDATYSGLSLMAVGLSETIAQDRNETSGKILALLRGEIIHGSSVLHDEIFEAFKNQGEEVYGEAPIKGLWSIYFRNSSHPIRQLSQYFQK